MCYPYFMLIFDMLRLLMILCCHDCLTTTLVKGMILGSSHLLSRWHESLTSTLVLVVTLLDLVSCLEFPCRCYVVLVLFFILFELMLYIFMHSFLCEWLIIDVGILQVLYYYGISIMVWEIIVILELFG